jgi:hypothetical protein
MSSARRTKPIAGNKCLAWLMLIDDAKTSEGTSSSQDLEFQGHKPSTGHIGALRKSRDPQDSSRTAAAM